MKNDVEGINEVVKNLKEYTDRLTLESAKEYLDLLSEYIDLYLHNERFKQQADMTIKQGQNPITLFMQNQGFKEKTIMPLFSLKKRSGGKNDTIILS